MSIESLLRRSVCTLPPDARCGEKTLLRNAMSSEPIFLTAERGLDQLVATMRQERVRRVPVVDAEGRLEGVVALDDLLPLLAEQLGDLAEAVRGEL